MTAQVVFREAGPMVPDALSKTFFFRGYQYQTVGLNILIQHEDYNFFFIKQEYGFLFCLCG